MALGIPSFTSDPAAGRRFIVGMQTPANKGVLGFGMTPDEVNEMRSQRIGAEMGLDPEILAQARHIDPTAMEKLGLRQMMEQREQEAADQRSEKVFQRNLEAQRMKQAQAEEEKRQRIEMLIQRGRGNAQLGTPVEWEQTVQSDPEGAARLLNRVTTNAMDENEQAMRNAAKQKGAEQLGETLAQQYATGDPELADKLRAYAHTENPNEATVKWVVRQHQTERQAKAEKDKLVALSLSNEARLPQNPEAITRYRGLIAGGVHPDKALSDITKEMSQEKAQARAEERDRLNDTRKQAEFAMKDAENEQEAAQKALEENDNPDTTPFLERRVRRAQEKYLEAQKIYRGTWGTHDTAPAAQETSTTPTQPDEPVAGATVPPVVSPPPAAVTGQASGSAGIQEKPGANEPKVEGLKHEELSKAADMGVPPKTKETLFRIRAELEKRLPHIVPQFLAEMRKAIRALPENQSAGPEWEAAVLSLARKYEAMMVQKAEPDLMNP